MNYMFVFFCLVVKEGVEKVYIYVFLDGCDVGLKIV